MANPTSNFGWQMPTSTDLVTDLPADFEVFGQAVDTSLADLKGGTTGQVLKKNTNADMDFVWSADSAGMTNPMTTTGDTIYSSSGSTPARLGIGTTGQVLTVAGGIPSWATPGGAGTSWTLLNTGGTALTGATTITITGISNKDKILVIIPLASTTQTQVAINLRFNSDSGANYSVYGTRMYSTTTYAAGNFSGLRSHNENQLPLGTTQTGATDYAYLSGGMLINGAASSGIKSVQYTGGGVNIGGNGQEAANYTGFYNSSSTISSVSIVSTNGNFDDGSIFVYTSS
jgi:hypothetical protein